MEPITHLLTGACLSRSGLNRKAAYATLTMVVAAEFPDIDMLWRLRGPIEGFQHHRGITHTLLGLPFEAALIVAGVYALHRWRVRRARANADATATADAAATTRVPSPSAGQAQRQEDGAQQRTARPPRVKPFTAAPVRWGVLYLLAMVALLSHLLLDYMNSYGLRPFFPFNDHWYAASIVFLFDPVIFVLLLSALVVPWLLGLVSDEVGVRKKPFRGRGWAIAALLGVVAWWGLRAVEHQRAVRMAMLQSILAPGQPVPAQAADATPAVPVYLPVRRVLVSPDLLSPFRWSAAMDFGPVYRLAEIDTLDDTLVMGETTFPNSTQRGTQRAVVLAAERSKLGRVYMDWSPMPLIEVTRPDSAFAPDAGGAKRAGDAVAHVVTFRDPRFMGGWLGEQDRTPLVGVVKLDRQNQVVEQSLDGSRE